MCSLWGGTVRLALVSLLLGHASSPRNGQGRGMCLSFIPKAPDSVPASLLPPVWPSLTYSPAGVSLRIVSSVSLPSRLHLMLETDYLPTVLKTFPQLPLA